MAMQYAAPTLNHDADKRKNNNPAMILHHYKVSPFAEKIRTMLGHAGLPWQSAISPAAPPRPIVDPLAGGYRRIPVAQIGADIFCDTRIISAEIADLSQLAELDSHNCSEAIQQFVANTDGPVFMAVTASAKPMHMARMVFTNFLPHEALRVIKDRTKMSKGTEFRKISRTQAKQTVSDFVSDLEAKLAQHAFLFGDKACIADFSAFHVIWFALKTQGGGVLSNAPKLKQWHKRMTAVGHGRAKKISRRSAFSAAQNSQPRDISEAQTQHELIGQQVIIQPNDYATDAVHGTLVGADQTRWILSREHAQLGTLHVHFPRQGFDITTLDE